MYGIQEKNFHIFRPKASSVKLNFFTCYIEYVYIYTYIFVEYLYAYTQTRP